MHLGAYITPGAGASCIGALLGPHGAGARCVGASGGRALEPRSRASRADFRKMSYAKTCVFEKAK